MSLDPRQIRLVSREDGPALLDIYAPLVLETAITFEFEPPSLPDFVRRIEHISSRYPWLVCEWDGHVAGFAHAGPHRVRPAYQWSVETSVYVHRDFHRRGIARRLYECLFELLDAQGFNAAYAGITLPNDASVAFHRSLGFEIVGVYREAGYKLGRWHDAVWYQRRIGGAPPNPPKPPLSPNEVSGTAPWTKLASGRLARQ